MANTVIQLKHSTLTGNVPSSLANGEISINSRDGKFFYSTPASVVITHYPYLGPAGLNKEIQFNDSGTLGANAGLAFDKTSGSLNVATSLIVSGRDLGAYANAAFLRANTPSDVANSAASYANGAFTRANNSINANTGGTITGNLTISGNLTMTGAGNISVANISITNNLSAITAALTVNSITTGTGTGGTIAGANTIYANTFVANTGGFIQFADGSKQFTANAGSAGTTDTFARGQANAAFIHANAAFNQANTGGGGTTDFGFGIIYTANNNTFANATTANAQVNFVGENGTVVYANATTKTITFAGTPGLQGLTVDYGFVNDPTYYSIDYGSLA
jgi:hypothetical protein